MIDRNFYYMIIYICVCVGGSSWWWEDRYSLTYGLQVKMLWQTTISRLEYYFYRVKGSAETKNQWSKNWTTIGIRNIWCWVHSSSLFLLSQGKATTENDKHVNKHNSSLFLSLPLPFNTVMFLCSVERG